MDILTSIKKPEIIGSKEVFVKTLQVAKVLFEEFILSVMLPVLAAIVLTNTPLDFVYLSQVCLKDTLILLLYCFYILEGNLTANEFCFIMVEVHVKIKPSITVIPHRGA